MQYELPACGDGSVSSATDFSSSDVPPLMPHSPSSSCTSSDSGSGSVKTEASLFTEDFVDMSPPLEDTSLHKDATEDCTNNTLNHQLGPQHHAQLPYYNAPWDAVNSQKMLLGNEPILNTDINAPALQHAPAMTGPGVYDIAMQQQGNFGRMATMPGAMQTWDVMDFSAMSQQQQQQQRMWPVLTSSIEMPTALQPGLQSSLPYMPTLSHGLPINTSPPTSAPHGTYPYHHGGELDGDSCHSIYPVPPSFDSPPRSASVDRFCGIDSYRSLKREHRPLLARHIRHRSSPLQRPRSRMDDDRYYPSKSPSRGYARRYYSESCSPRSFSVEDSDFDEETGEIVVGGAERTARDEFLLKYRSKGWTYKQIRERGNFAEAESTLRGRYRTLTKEKEARVRKPEWHANDIKLLKRAVKKLGKSDSKGDIKKISWKQVAEYISESGGSYSFGYATCRKRWDELTTRKEDADGS
ncbi:uncharacterized protein B0I36DRAFT_345775 [Microdochium trichocladiopsis]|uniref:Myb-like domain-containing protein n=1 Tax=Microdochium trichocladiopsis TaxID=1682393 RepID=A0A9P8YED7_9PEZI|nr:uncharacterized protein B0I36DRAFT_345775 [Microdochium trichocladiopsis]KAH7037699.1 hypothetical protein B0I36DRAFT_345775 [Microdochium trichocladiopsis]